MCFINQEAEISTNYIFKNSSNSLVVTTDIHVTMDKPLEKVLQRLWTIRIYIFCIIRSLFSDEIYYLFQNNNTSFSSKDLGIEGLSEKLVSMKLSEETVGKLLKTYLCLMLIAYNMIKGCIF